MKKLLLLACLSLSSIYAMAEIRMEQDTTSCYHLEYDRIELLDSSKPYCKVRKNRMWQIYDIERHELVSDEWFEEVVQCDEYVYRLKSQNGDKYMTIQWYYNRYDEEQSAVISDELPVKIEE